MAWVGIRRAHCRFSLRWVPGHSSSPAHSHFIQREDNLVRLGEITTRMGYNFPAITRKIIAHPGGLILYQSEHIVAFKLLAASQECQFNQESDTCYVPSQLLNQFHCR